MCLTMTTNISVHVQVAKITKDCTIPPNGHITVESARLRNSLKSARPFPLLGVGSGYKTIGLCVHMYHWVFGCVCACIEFGLFVHAHVSLCLGFVCMRMYTTGYLRCVSPGSSQFFNVAHRKNRRASREQHHKT